MKIDVQKHLLKTVQRLGSAIDGVVRLRNNTYGNTNLEKVIDKAVDWYESDNINAYSFFNDAFPCDNGPTDFYSGLGSFLCNSILDDSCFELVWIKFDDRTCDEIVSPEEAWSEDLIVSVKAIWSHDDSPNRSTDSGLMLKAMEYLDEKDRRREELDRKWEETLKRIHGK